MPARTNLPEATPVILSESLTHIVVAVEIPKATLARHRRFLKMLLEAAIPRVVEDE